jgi:A/G-specific adenine glycosylase
MSRRPTGLPAPGAAGAPAGGAAGAAVSAPIAGWYTHNGRHDLPWRPTRDRWAVLVSEVMLQQTQVGRVAGVWPGFMARFPTPEAMAAAGPGDVIAAWGTLGYPRRARRLWEAAERIAAHGWPEALTDLPGVGRYTADAVSAQVDERDAPAIETNIRRVVERRAGRTLSPSEAAAASREAGRPLNGRDRLLALMDIGALLCRPRAPRCPECPLEPGCATASSIASETTRPATPPRVAGDPSARPRDTGDPPAGVPWRTLGRRARQPAYEGSFRQRRGRVLAELRAGPRPSADLDPAALATLVEDGLAALDGPIARLP